ncbi:MAG TPA: exodeoxyribonuclease V subunit alpha [Motilibacteraceae bacterium]|nr:exodeoxyribonuclease V subunit alpha [Motilibacteraceae bacterium]
MTSLDARVAVGATGLLRTFNEAGVLTAADVHLATRLGRLGEEADEAVLLAAALVARSTRNGSVVLDVRSASATTVADELPDGEPVDVATLPWPEPAAWLAALSASPLVGDGSPEVPLGAPSGRALTPLRLHDGLLWLDRYWQQEGTVAQALLARAVAPAPALDPETVRAALVRLWPDADAVDQRAATAAALLQPVAVVGGGPGTGKTTTVARLLAALVATAPDGRVPRWALAAPTGKAAARLQESIQEAAATQVAGQAGGVLTPPEAEALRASTATTLHRLLQIPRNGRPRRHAGDPLPHDVVVVDEASMVSLTLMTRLLDALRPDARLLLVGDPDQLASVEAGAVLADLVDPVREQVLASGPGGQPARTAGAQQRFAAVLPDVAPRPPSQIAPDSPGARLRDGVVLLRRVHRFAESGGVGRLAEALRAGDPEATLALLADRRTPGLAWLELPEDGAITPAAVDHLQARTTALADRLVHLAGWRDGELVAAPDEDVRAALDTLGTHRLLCAHRAGPFGVGPWSATMARWSVEATGVLPRRDGRYPGQPLLVTANDPDTGLSNGDSGLVVVGPEGTLVAAFSTGGSDPLVLPLGRLGDVRPLYASTVHRAQGSQLDEVSVLLPPADSPLATTQTLYTAVTRARSRVTVIGSAEAVRRSVLRRAARATGLRLRLA